MRVEQRDREEGFMLLGLIVAIFLILLALSVAAPKVAYELRREREVETVRRGNQYVRAIQLYYRKFGHYPGSIEQLEKTNNMRFLRQQYVDPMTGKADWRLIKVGEAKTTVKGFFGKPLAGMAPGLGSAAGMASAGGIGAGAAGVPGTGPTGVGSGSAFGSSGPGTTMGSGTGSAFGSSSPTSSGPGTSGPGTTGATGTTTATAGESGGGSSSGATGTTGTTGSSGSSGSGFGQSASSFTGGGAPFVGVGLVKDGDAIITLNEQTTYPTWEFIYDPRIEQLKAAAALQSGANSTGLSGFGSGSTPSAAPGSGFGGTTSGPGTTTSPGTTTPTSPTGTSPAPQ
jgi:type II secretory pathway pseudopilin PulG